MLIRRAVTLVEEIRTVGERTGEPRAVVARISDAPHPKEVVVALRLPRRLAPASAWPPCRRSSDRGAVVPGPSGFSSEVFTASLDLLGRIGRMSGHWGMQPSTSPPRWASHVVAA